MKLIDLQKQTSTISDTATITLGAVVDKFRTVAQAIAAGDLGVGDTGIPFFVRDPVSGAWEAGLYTITSATQLAREKVLSGSSGSTAVAFGGVACEVYSAAPAAAVAQLSGARDIPFATVVPLTQVGTAFMPSQTVASVLAFSVAASPVRGALAFVRLVADGVNAPTFSGMKEWNGSSGYDNRNGIVNVVQFFCDGVDVWYSIAQAVGAAPVAAKPGAPTIGSASAGDGIASVAFTAPSSNGGAAITEYAVTAYKASDNSVVKTVTAASSPANFTGLTNGVAVYFKVAATNSAGTGPQSAASNAVTPAVAAVTYTRLNNLTNVTEIGTGPYSYAGVAGSAYNGAGGVSPRLPENTDGSIAFKMNSLASGNSFLLGVSVGSSKVPYQNTFIALYADAGNSQNYTTITDGNAGGRVATGLAAQDGDIMRVRRSGTRFTAEVARSNDPTNFTPIRYFDNTNTGDVYFQVDVAGATAIAQNIAGAGLS